MSIFDNRVPSPEDIIYVVHHPFEDKIDSAKLIATSKITEVENGRIHYKNCTKKGSSGAPILDVQGRLLGLHQGVCIKEGHKECVIGIAMHTILGSIEQTRRDELLQGFPPVTFETKMREQREASINNLQQQLKKAYSDHFAHLSLILTAEKFPIEIFFTNLAVVSQDSQERKENELRTKRDPQLVEKDSLREIYTRFYGDERFIKISSLFKSEEGSPVKKILILGIAGVGKSTLCQKIAYNWASTKKKLFADKFKVLYFLTFRDLNGWAEQHPLKLMQDPDEWLSQAIAECCCQSQAEILQTLQNNREEILFLLDGWDEASSKLIRSIETCFQKDKIKYCLLTSRPGITNKIKFDKIVENVGFTSKDISVYAEKFFKLTNNQDLEAFLTHIESQSDLFTICHIPIQLQILCSLWTQGEREFPKSITAIVSKIIYHLFDWEKKDEKYETMSDYKKSLLYDALGEIALKGLENRELIISESLIVSVLEDKKYRKLELKSEDLIRSGLIKGCGKNGEMYFIHLIYQEYCIAKATSKLAEDKRCEFVQKYRYKPHFHLVMRMLTGCIWERSEKNLSELETFFGSFYRKPIDLIGTYQTTLVLSCLNECKNEKLEEAIWEKYKIEKCINSVLRLDAFKNFIWEIMPISIKAFNRILNYFLSSSSSGEIEFFVCMLSKFFRKDYLCEDLWQLIHKVDIKKNQSTFFNVNFGIGIKIIASIGRIEVEEKVLEIAQNIIPTCENLSVKQNVVAALGLIGGKDSLNWLKEKFYSGDPNMRLLVAQAFEGIGNLVVEKTPDLLLQWLEGSIQDKDGAEFLKWIEEGFEDSNPALSGIAATAIEKVVCNLGEKDFGRLFSSIEKGFESEKLLVRKIVAQSIKSISESKENLNQARLLDFILQICRDPTLMQRDVILNVLEKILDKVDKTKIIGWMQEELSNNGFQECELFFEILEEISCNIPEQMIVSILDILIKKSRVNAAKKIIKTSKKESNLKVLNWLVQNLSSSNSSPLSLLVTVLEEFSWQVPKEIASEMLKLSKEKLLRFFEVDQHVQSMVKEVIESNESKLDWLKQQIKDSNFAVFKSIGDSLERVSDDKSQQNSQIISLLFKENQKLCGFYEVDDIVTIFRKLIEKSQGVDRDNVLKLLEELFLDNNFQSLWVAAKFFEKIPFKINEEKFQKFLEAGLSHKDYNLQVETLNLIEAIADHLEERNRVKILTLLDKILSINKSEVGKHFFSFVIEVFGIVAEKIREGELKKENILNILSWLKINIFSAECFYIKGFARALRAASCYLVKEEIEEILKELRKGIQDKEETRMKIFTLSFGCIVEKNLENNEPQILECLKIGINSQVLDVRKTAIKTFGTIGVKERNLNLALNILEQALFDDKMVKQAALQALDTIAGQIGEEGKLKILNIIKKNLLDRRFGLFKEAIEFLEKNAEARKEEIINDILDLITAGLSSKNQLLYRSIVTEPFEIMGSRVREEAIDEMICLIEMMISQNHLYYNAVSVRAIKAIENFINEKRIPKILPLIEKAFANKYIFLEKTVSRILQISANRLVTKDNLSMKTTDQFLKLIKTLIEHEDFSINMAALNAFKTLMWRAEKRNISQIVDILTLLSCKKTFINEEAPVLLQMLPKGLLIPTLFSIKSTDILDLWVKFYMLRSFSVCLIPIQNTQLYSIQLGDTIYGENITLQQKALLEERIKNIKSEATIHG